jgi:hypothetical protein
VSTNWQPVINIEVIVPHIVLPTVSEKPALGNNTVQQQQTPPALPEDGSQSSEKVEEYVRLVPHDPQISPQPHQPGDQQDLQSATSRHSTHKGAFGLFHIKNVPLQGQKLLLQVLRQWKNQRHTREDQDVTRVTDDLVLMVESHQLNTGDPPGVVLIPGVNRVTITFDKEGTLSGYSIDGTES